MKKIVHLAAFLCLLPLWPLIQSPLIAAEDTVKLVKNVKPAVVLIQTFDANSRPSGSGSGFFINNKGHIITNHHVIEGAYWANVRTMTGQNYYVQGIIAKDAEADIVKLSIDIPDSNIVPLKLSTAIPSEGEDVIVIGNPLGLESTVSTGIVSAVRDIPAFGKILQITAPISPGSSGSPVLNTKGEVIGVATLIATKGQNLNFAVPSDKIIALKETAKTPLFKEYTSATADVNSAEKLYYRGLIELWQESWAAALTYFQKATTKNPHYADAWFNVGYCYSKLGRHQDAIEAFKQAIRIKPDYAEAHYNLGVSYGKLGRYQDTIEAYKQAIRIKPDLAEAHCNLGVAYGKLGRHQDAIEAYKQAIRIKPDDAEAHYNLGLVYGSLGHYQEAIESLKQAIRIKPDDTEAHYNLGFAYGGLSRWQEAIDAFKQAIRIKPDYAEAHSNLGIAYGKLGRYQDEIESCKQAIRIKPDLAEAHYNLGGAYSKLGRYQDAIEAYKQAIGIKPDDAKAHYNLGVAYLDLGRHQDAIEAFKQAIKIKPDDAEAHYNLGNAYLITGDKDSALEEYKILKTLDTESANELFNQIYK